VFSSLFWIFNMAKRLQTPGDVRRFLAALVNNLAAGKVKPDVAGRVAYICNILVRTMEIDFNQSTIFTLQQRIDQLETRLGD
jgi:hypothetical protein